MLEAEKERCCLSLARFAVMNKKGNSTSVILFTMASFEQRELMKLPMNQAFSF